MKILQIIPMFSVIEPFGGSHIVIYQISKALVKRGHEVTIYTSDIKNPHTLKREKKNVEVIDGIKIIRFKNLNSIFSRITKTVITPGMVNTLDKEIHNFDIIHLHEPRNFQHLLVHKYSNKKSVPYIIQAHGVLPIVKPQQSLKKIYDRFCRDKLLKDASAVIALTNTEAQQYKSVGVCDDKIKIVPNGIDLSEFKNLPSKGEFRRKYGLKENHKLILYLGRIDETKGLDLLSKAFRYVSETLNEARLIIVGPDDGYTQSLKRLIKSLNIEEKVLLTGPIYGKDKEESCTLKSEVYIDSDVHVLFRSWEPFGITILESCACGTPVICSTGCGIADVIDGQAGIAIPYSEDELAKALLHILSDDKKRQIFGEKGKSLVHNKFNWSRIAEQLESIYENCIPISN
jgi:glycosyltransferase involved in cell wall biosynthesis